METVKETWGMACPSCQRDDRLKVVARVWATLFPEGTEIDDSDHEWDDHSTCACGACGWKGFVDGARVREDLI